MPIDTKPTSESDPFQPVGKILDQDGGDVSARDRSDDGTIIIRRNREIGHNYTFGQFPLAPWKRPTEIRLTQGRVAIVEARDFERLSKWNWHYQHKHDHEGYAARNIRNVRGGNQSRVLMHRYIMGAEPREEIDHINGNGLDNRRSNLRFSTHSQNLANMRRDPDGKSSQYKGVSLTERKAKPWRARIRYHYKGIHLGYFATEEEAARAYDKKAIELFGEFSHPNFPSLEV